MAEQLICNQQVDGSTPFTSSKVLQLLMGDFPSGQRGQTVNLLSTTSLVRIQHPPPKKSTSFDLSIFLFKPQAWYVITRQRVWYRRRRMESSKVHFLRLDSIPSCNGFHTMFCIDSIHASRRDVAHEFKSIRKLPEISFLFIQAVGLAYHPTQVGISSRATSRPCISSRASVHLACGLMLYNTICVDDMQFLWN